MSDIKDRQRLMNEAFEAGRQSVLQGGVVVPREDFDSAVAGIDRLAELLRRSRIDRDQDEADGWENLNLDLRPLLAGSTPENGETT